MGVEVPRQSVQTVGERDSLVVRADVKRLCEKTVRVIHFMEATLENAGTAVRPKRSEICRYEFEELGVHPKAGSKTRTASRMQSAFAVPMKGVYDSEGAQVAFQICHQETDERKSQASAATRRQRLCEGVTLACSRSCNDQTPGAW